MNDFGEFLRTLRGKRSLREIAQLTGLSHTYIMDCEKGMSRQKIKFVPSPETLYKLSKAYNYPFLEMMKISGVLPDTIEETIRIIDDDTPMSVDGVVLTHEQKKKVLQMIRLMFGDKPNE